MIFEICPACGVRNETGSRNCEACGESTVIRNTPKADDPGEFEMASDSNLSLGTDVNYDPRIIAVFSDQLYRRARWIEILWAAIGAISLGILAYTVADTLGLMGGLVIGGVLGFYLGQARAFLLRLQAQFALCAVQIEKNTRR